MGLGGLPTLNGIREFRDGVLMQSASGALMVDVYYRLAPYSARFLQQSPWALATGRGVFRAVWWAAAQKELLFMILLALVLSRVTVRRLRLRRLTAALFVVVALGLAVMPAQALLKYMSTGEMVKASQDIITGRVTSVESHFMDDSNRIVTDVAIEIDQIAKGTLNKKSTLHLTVPGGRVGSIVSVAPELPTFKQEEEVLLFLDYTTTFGHVVTSGKRGKYIIETNEKTGKKYVAAGNIAAQLGLDEKPASPDTADDGSVDDTDAVAPDGQVALDDYLDLLRKTAAEQKDAS